jgi:hypothetical protein
MGYARSRLCDSGLDVDLRKHFPATLLYLEDKADLMATIMYFTFGDASPVPKDLQPVLLKQAFTAISFGARQTANGWLDASGNWTNPALVDILKNGDDRKRFLSDKTVKLFIKEQNALDDYLYELVKKHVQICFKQASCKPTVVGPAKPRSWLTFISTARRRSWTSSDA